MTLVRFHVVKQDVLYAIPYMVGRVIMSCLMSIALVSALQQKWLCRAGAPPEWQRSCQFSVEGKGQIPRSPRVVASFYALSESGQSRQGEGAGPANV
jgi:hypothetical protein